MTVELTGAALYGLGGATHTAVLNDTTTSATPAGLTHATPSTATEVFPPAANPSPVRVMRAPAPPKWSGVMDVTLAPTVTLAPPYHRDARARKHTA